jgi:hypothetical protein
LPTLPSEKSLSVKRVKGSISIARKHLFNLPGKKERALLVIPHLGYRATVDAEDKAKQAVPSITRKADLANVAAAQMINSINVKDIPNTEDNKETIEKMKIYGVYVNTVEKKRMETQKLLEAIKKTKL